jgi:hypothetical protein
MTNAPATLRDVRIISASKEGTGPIVFKLAALFFDSK